MEKDIQLGAEAEVILKIENAKVSIGMQYTGKQASANAGVTLDVEQFAKLLKDAIPGTLDDTVIDLLIAAMKASV
jgi:hypothetical protein